MLQFTCIFHAFALERAASVPCEVLDVANDACEPVGDGGDEDSAGGAFSVGGSHTKPCVARALNESYSCFFLWNSTYQTLRVHDRLATGALVAVLAPDATIARSTHVRTIVRSVQRLPLMSVCWCCCCRLCLKMTFVSTF